MKFKPLYFYSVLVAAVIITLIIVSQPDNKVNTKNEETMENQNMPNDEIHSQLKSKDAPSKENVSQEFKHRMEILKKNVEENPGDTVALKQYADLLASAHMQKQSVEYYEKILAVNPNRIDILFSISFVYYSIGNLNKAEEHTEQILAIDPQNTDAQYNLAAIAASKGDKEKAREIWQRLADKYPDEDVGIKASNSLKQL